MRGTVASFMYVVSVQFLGTSSSSKVRSSTCPPFVSCRERARRAVLRVIAISLLLWLWLHAYVGIWESAGGRQTGVDMAAQGNITDGIAPVDQRILHAVGNSAEAGFKGG